MSKFKYTGNARAIVKMVDEKKGGKKTGRKVREYNAGTIVAGVEFPPNVEVEVAEGSPAYRTVSRLANEENGPFELVGGEKPAAKKEAAPKKAAKKETPPPPPAKKEGDE